MKKRLCTALCYTFGAIVITVLFLFISWAVFKWVNIPYTEIALDVGKNVDRTKPITVPGATYSDKQM